MTSLPENMPPLPFGMPPVPHSTQLEVAPVMTQVSAQPESDPLAVARETHQPAPVAVKPLLTSETTAVPLSMTKF